MVQKQSNFARRRAYQTKTIDIDPNFDFTDISKRTTKPVINTKIPGGSTSGKAEPLFGIQNQTGGGTGASKNCGGCDAWNIGCEIGKLSCEFTSSFGNALSNPWLLGGLGVVGVIILVVVLKRR